MIKLTVFAALVLIGFSAACSTLVPERAPQQAGHVQTREEAEAARGGCKGAHKMGDMWMVCESTVSQTTTGTLKMGETGGHAANQNALRLVWPLATISIGIVPMGVICIGVVPMGVVSIGVVAMGVINIAIVGMGLLAVGVDTMGVITAGPMSMGLIQIRSTTNPRISLTPQRSRRTGRKLAAAECIAWVRYWMPCGASSINESLSALAIRADRPDVQGGFDQLEPKPWPPSRRRRARSSLSNSSVRPQRMHTTW